jgi:hypothetical protein
MQGATSANNRWLDGKLGDHALWLRNLLRFAQLASTGIVDSSDQNQAHCRVMQSRKGACCDVRLAFRNLEAPTRDPA